MDLLVDVIFLSFFLNEDTRGRIERLLEFLNRTSVAKCNLIELRKFKRHFNRKQNLIFTSMNIFECIRRYFEISRRNYKSTLI